MSEVIKSEGENQKSKCTRKQKRITYCNLRPKNTHHLRIQVHLEYLGASIVLLNLSFRQASNLFSLLSYSFFERTLLVCTRTLALLSNLLIIPSVDKKILSDVHPGLVVFGLPFPFPHSKMYVFSTSQSLQRSIKSPQKFIPGAIIIFFPSHHFHKDSL